MAGSGVAGEYEGCVATDTDDRDRWAGTLGVASVVLVAAVLAVAELQHVARMADTVGAAAFTAIPLVVTLWLIGAMLWAARDRPTRDRLRLAGWVFLGMVAILVLAGWNAIHQRALGFAIGHAEFVLVSNLSGGGVIGFLIGYYDVLHRRAARDARGERARLEFLHTTLRHNVLNGLNIILGNAALLETDADGDAQARLATIHDRGEELARFTKATTALLENFDDTTDIELGPTHLATVLDREADRFRHQHPHADISVDVPADLYVTGDDFAPDLFGNLLSNAVEHNDAATPTVSVTADATADLVDVHVADNGPGIPDGAKQRMQRWNTKSPDSAGTGLGLAIANTIATRYDGRLHLEDNHPTGTVAVVELPRATPPD